VAKDEVRVDGVGARVARPGSRRRLRVVVDAHVTEIEREPRLEELA
jgi:hypothetical protein